ncbi:MAG: hypothetical protein ACJ8C4_00440 [Gemmataceae bacterium]
MPALLKRILMRGSFVALATMAIALALRWVLESYLESDGAIIISGDRGWALEGPLMFAAFGFLLTALLEWVSDRRDRAKQIGKP